MQSLPENRFEDVYYELKQLYITFNSYFSPKEIEYRNKILQLCKEIILEEQNNN